MARRPHQQMPEYRARERMRQQAPEFKAWDSQRKHDLKLEALNAYGGPTCANCGEDEFKRLGLDHINEDGAAHRHALGTHSGHNFYHALRLLGWPNDPPLQVLCASCNTAKKNRARTSPGVIVGGIAH